MQMSEAGPFFKDYGSDDASDCPSEDERDAVDGLVILGGDSGIDSTIEDQGTGAVLGPKEGRGSFLEEDKGDNTGSDGAAGTTEQPDVLLDDDALEGSTNVTVKRTRSPWSVAHDEIVEKKLTVISLDMETGGPECGIVQISAIGAKMDGQKIGQFDSYIKPPPCATWLDSAISVHKLGPNHPKIIAAKPIEVVWPQFEATINQWTENGEKKAVVVAWSGETCDIQWLFNVTEVSHKGILKMPKGLVFYMDPCFVMSHYKTCPLNEKNRGEVGHGLETVWCYLNGATKLDGAHNAIVDAQAQMDVIFSDKFIDFWDKPKSMKLMGDVFGKKKQKQQEQADELKRKVPPGWTEDYTSVWEPNEEQQYTGNDGDTSYGPTPQAREAARSGLVDLFLFFFPINLLQNISDRTNFYGTKEWVREVRTKDRDGHDTSKNMFVRCESWHVEACHRVEENWRDVTIGYMMAWIGILLINGAFKICYPRIMWFAPPYGVPVPYAESTMIQDAFLQIQGCIHFLGNKTIYPKGRQTWNPLQKI